MRAVLYVRCSTNEDKQSTEGQETALRSWCEANGHTVAKVYQDYASGRTSDREQWDKLNREAANPRRGWDMVVFYDLSRITREGALQSLQYLERWHMNGVKFASLMEPYLNSLGPFGPAIIALIGAVNKAWVDTQREKVKAGLARAKKNGKTLGRKATIDRRKVEAMLCSGATLTDTAAACGCSVASVKNIKRDMRDRAIPK